MAGDAEIVPHPPSFIAGSASVGRYLILGALERGRRYGMELSEAVLRQVEAKENLVKARVAVHAFRVEAVRKPVNDGLAVTRQTWGAGQDALKERDHRRRGLGVSLVAIFITITGLWLAIRRIEAKQNA